MVVSKDLLKKEDAQDSSDQPQPKTDQIRSQEYPVPVGLQYFYDWLKNEMPDLNGKVLRKEIDLSVLVDRTKEIIARMPKIEEYDLASARSALQCLGFAISSVERHAQDKGMPAGEALRGLAPGLEDTLIKLGEIAKHSPRDTVYTFALWNPDDETITFTGDDQERLFIDVVKKSFGFTGLAANNVEIVAGNDGLISDENNLALLEQASDYMELLRKQYLRYMEKHASGERALTVDFFLNIFRQYNCTFPINGEDWGAPTAANGHYHWMIDLMVQPVEEGYKNHILGRFRYLTDEDAERLTEIMNKPSLIDKLALELGSDAQKLPQMSDEEFSEFFNNLSAEGKRAVDTVGKLIEAHASARAMHWTLIENYMIRPEKMNVAKATTVAADRGTSGLTLAEVAHIRDSTLQNPFLRSYKNQKRASQHRSK